MENTDFKKEGVELRSNSWRRKRRRRSSHTEESIDTESIEMSQSEISSSVPTVAAVLHPSDLKVLDQVLDKMRGYDPLIEEHGDPRTDKEVVVDHEYFILSEEDDVDTERESDSPPITPSKRRKVNRKSKKNVISKRTERRTERMKDHRKEALRDNKRRCRVWRWRRRKIRVKCNKDSEAESVESMESVFYRYRLRTVGDVAAALYNEGNSNSWNKDKGYALKLVRGAKENLIAFFQHILTSAEKKDILRMTPEFATFHRALGTIEDTKIFGKRSKRWGAKLHEMQLQRKRMTMPVNVVPSTQSNGNLMNGMCSMSVFLTDSGNTRYLSLELPV